MRGSSQASRRSLSKVPITVSTDSIMMKLPARYMSWLISDCSSSGPVIGRLRTTAVIVAPDTRVGSTQPTVEMNGLSAIRTGYLSSSRFSERP